MLTELLSQLLAAFQSNLTLLVFLFDFMLKSFFLVALAKYYERVTSPFFSSTQKHRLWLTVLVLLGLLPLVALLNSLMLSDAQTVPNLTLVTVLVPSELVEKSTESIIYQDSLLKLLAGAYIFVVSVHLARLISSLRQIQRVHRDADFDTPVAATALLHRLGGKLKVSRPVSLGVSALCSSPMTYGTFRPTIILPNSHYYEDQTLLENVLLHELGHIRRADHIAYLACYLIAAVNWFNPFAWIALRQLSLESEYACDDEVLRHRNRPAEFAGQLLSIARCGLDVQDRALASRSIISRGELSLRIENILQSNANLQHGKMYSSLFPICMLLGLFLLTSTGKIFALENESEYASEDLRLIYSEIPEYPEPAFEKGITGSAQFSFNVDALGRVDPHSVVLRKSDPNRLFAQPSRAALDKFVFAPRKVNGRRVSTSGVNYTFEFDIRI